MDVLAHSTTSSIDDSSVEVGSTPMSCEDGSSPTVSMFSASASQLTSDSPLNQTVITSVFPAAFAAASASHLDHCGEDCLEMMFRFLSLCDLTSVLVVCKSWLNVLHSDHMPRQLHVKMNYASMQRMVLASFSPLRCHVRSVQAEYIINENESLNPFICIDHTRAAALPMSCPNNAMNVEEIQVNFVTSKQTLPLLNQEEYMLDDVKESGEIKGSDTVHILYPEFMLLIDGVIQLIAGTSVSRNDNFQHLKKLVIQLPPSVDLTELHSMDVDLNPLARLAHLEELSIPTGYMNSLTIESMGLLKTLQRFETNPLAMASHFTRAVYDLEQQYVRKSSESNGTLREIVPNIALKSLGAFTSIGEEDMRAMQKVAPNLTELTSTTCFALDAYPFFYRFPQLSHLHEHHSRFATRANFVMEALHECAARIHTVQLPSLRFNYWLQPEDVRTPKQFFLPFINLEILEIHIPGDLDFLDRTVLPHLHSLTFLALDSSECSLLDDDSTMPEACTVKHFKTVGNMPPELLQLFPTMVELESMQLRMAKKTAPKIEQVLQTLIKLSPQKKLQQLELNGFTVDDSVSQLLTNFCKMMEMEADRIQLHDCELVQSSFVLPDAPLLVRRA